MIDQYPLVSAVITTHNRAALLRRAIESVLSQTYPRIECIVVDDNSTDNTRDLCTQFENVRYIHIGANETGGGNHARNCGIQASRGKYVAFLDDDDCWLPEKTSQQVEALQDHGAGVSFCARRRELVDINGNVSYSDQRPDPNFNGDVSRMIFGSIPATTSTLMVCTDLLRLVRGFDEQLQFWQEYDLMVRLSQLTTFAQVPDQLTLYRIDIGDAERLSSKYGPWLEAVSYFERKHRARLELLTLGERTRHKRLIADDALLRLSSGKQPWKRFCIRSKYLFLTLMCKIIKS